MIHTAAVHPGVIHTAVVAARVVHAGVFHDAVVHDAVVHDAVAYAHVVVIARRRTLRDCRKQLHAALWAVTRLIAHYLRMHRTCIGGHGGGLAGNQFHAAFGTAAGFSRLPAVLRGRPGAHPSRTQLAPERPGDGYPGTGISGRPVRPSASAASSNSISGRRRARKSS
jgi:hypothetical protein